MSIKRAGPIEGDPICGLCYRKCIEVTKIFDGCITRFPDVPYVAHIEPQAAPFPYVYVEAHSDGETVIQNLHVLVDERGEMRENEAFMRLEQERGRGTERQRRNGARNRADDLPLPLPPRPAQVEFDAKIPIEITFECADGKVHHAHSTVTLHRRVRLLLPPPSLTPYTIKCCSTLVSNLGTFITPTELNCRACVFQIIKVTGTVDMLIPSYGYCEYPEVGENLCEAIDDLPLFPPFA